MRRLASCLAILVSVGCPNAARAAGSGPQRRHVPVIYCTDLLHPPDDPDDHFDLAALYAMDELDLRLIVLDQGDKQLQRPGALPVWQLNRLTGRSVPAVIGLGRRLKSPIDPALDQPGEFQNGVAMILRTLRDSPDPVMIATVGSVRDVVAAFNRDPSLFHRKVGKLMAFLGDASHPTFREYNVDLDPMAYIGLMRSRLPIYWVPCFDGGPWKNEGHASYWRASQGDLLAKASDEVLQYFIYALWKKPGDQAFFLSTPVDQEKKQQLFAGMRNLWGAALLGTLSGRRVVLEGDNYRSVTKESPEAKRHAMSEDLYGFSAVDLSITDDGGVQYGTAPNSHRMRRFEVRNPAKYAQGLTAATAALLSKIRISTPYGLCNYPSVSISNGMVDATIVLPDRISGYYRGSRFDWSGMVAQIVY
ncbi:MAG: hypothetical protein HY318_05685, partial [Armatimonadetes bacterium]|nr:hypothetical protein [Armatimonadota bacterium]